jgi:hypothetical protein
MGGRHQSSPRKYSLLSGSRRLLLLLQRERQTNVAAAEVEANYFLLAGAIREVVVVDESWLSRCTGVGAGTASRKGK